MHDRRRLALDALRLRGELSINELARELRLTRTAAANHMARLLADGLVSRTGLQASRRRPSIVYGLTAQADRLFHQEYETFAVDVLDEIACGGVGQVDRVLRRVGDRWTVRDVPGVRTLRGSARLERATKIIAARGFMPTLERAGRRYVLRNHNCPIARVCGTHHQAAEMVRHWIEALAGAAAQRSSCICQGSRACEYTLSPKPTRVTRKSAA